MKTSSKAKDNYDCIFEVDIPEDTLTKAFTGTLKDKYGLLTESIDESNKVFVSWVSSRSFLRAITSSVPPKITWSVKKTSQEQAHIRMKFELSVWLKVRLYFIAVFLACMAYVAGNMPADFFQLPLPVSVGIIGWFIAVPVILTSFLMTSIIFSLLDRYNAWGDKILFDICTNLSRNTPMMQYRAIPVAESRQVIDNKISIVFIVSLLCSAVFVLDKSHFEFIMNSGLTAKVILLLLLIIAFIAIFITYKKRVGLYQGQKVLGTANNCIMSFAILFLLLGTPLVVKSNIHTGLDTIKALNSSKPIAISNTEAYSESYGRDSTDSHTRKLMWSLLYVCFLFYANSFIVWLLFVYLLLSVSCEVGSVLGGTGSAHQQFLDYILKNKVQGDADKNIAHRPIIPLSTKVVLWLLFFALSGVFWLTIFFNLSILNMLVLPQWPLLPALYGEFIVSGTKTIAATILAGNATQWSVKLLSFVLLIPAIAPFLLYVYFTIKSFLRLHKTGRYRVCFESDIAQKSKDIAAKMGVSGISCVLDEHSISGSPWADVRGYLPKKIIVFTRASLEFLEKFSEHGEAIIAHEIAHLKYDCTRIWFLRIISRLGLVGAGFWSVLLNSLEIEDRADNEACKYLRENNMNEKLLTEAAFMLETRDCLDGKICSSRQALVMAFHARQKTGFTELPKEHRSIWQKIARAFQMVHEFYFDTELYDYIHRDSIDRMLRLENRKIATEAVK
ncbi:MAG: hypothetical protein PHP01_00595 [Phycisphaerae bacterium]|nr:hypothetical protein [Phycisphaerae bacterium]